MRGKQNDSGITGMIFLLGLVLAKITGNGWTDSVLFGILLALVVALILTIRRPQSQKKQPVKKSMSSKMLKHYEKSGLSGDEIDLFRDTMRTTEKQIERLEQNLNSNPTLHALENKEQPVRVSKALFKEIVKEPQNLSKISDFLYKHLPTLLHLSDKYLEINQHEVKTEDAYTVLDQSLDVMRQLSQKIKQDYADFVADDLDDIDTTISIAKDQLDERKPGEGHSEEDLHD